MKKSLRVIAAIIAMMSMLTVNVQAKSIHFFLTKGEKKVTDNTKDVDEAAWYITIDKPTGNSIYNFVKGQTVVGFRVRRTSSDTSTALSDYFTVSDFVDNKGYQYREGYVPKHKDKIYLHTQVDSTSKIPYVSFDGKWVT